MIWAATATSAEVLPDHHMLHLVHINIYIILAFFFFLKISDIKQQQPKK